ncbi:MAG: acyloxyacyl hydrolase [Stellaceae bacterium]
MRGKFVAWIAAAWLMLLPFAAHAGSGLIDEMKLGVLEHDVPIGVDHRECCVDVNGEVLFTSPSVLSWFWAPRPNLGVTINTEGKNSYGYFGLAWAGDFLRHSFRPGDSFFWELGLGGAVHDGPNQSSPYTRDHMGLGSRILFHEELDLGYRFTWRSNLSLFLDHISDADLTQHNPGLTNLGVRLGFRF